MKAIHFSGWEPTLERDSGLNVSDRASCKITIRCFLSDCKRSGVPANFEQARVFVGTMTQQQAPNAWVLQRWKDGLNCFFPERPREGEPRRAARRRNNLPKPQAPWMHDKPMHNRTRMNHTYPTSRIKDMAAGERPQERLEKHGPQALSDRELLALILRSGQRGIDIVTLTGDLLSRAGSLPKLLHWPREDFMQIHGIGAVKAAQLVTVMELAKRVILAWDEDATERIFDTPAVVAQQCRSRIAGLDVEKFWVLCLDRKNRLIKDFEVTSGTATSSLVHPREVFREAIRINATAILAVHNHPSGDPAPSRADIQVTRQLREAAKVIQIDLLDHIILGRRQHDPQGLGYYSFNDAGLL